MACECIWQWIISAQLTRFWIGFLWRGARILLSLGKKSYSKMNYDAQVLQKWWLIVQLLQWGIGRCIMQCITAEANSNHQLRILWWIRWSGVRAVALNHLVFFLWGFKVDFPDSFFWRWSFEFLQVGSGVGCVVIRTTGSIRVFEVEFPWWKWWVLQRSFPERWVDVGKCPEPLGVGFSVVSLWVLWFGVERSRSGCSYALCFRSRSDGSYIVMGDGSDGS